MINDRKLLFRFSHREHKIAADTTWWPSFENRKQLMQGDGLTPDAILDRIISDKVALYQLVGGLQTGLDICPPQLR